MDERGVIADRLAKKRQEIAALEEKLRSAKIYLQALEDITKAFGASEETARPDSVLKSGSAVSQARDAILKAGKSLHIADIVAAIGREDTRDVRGSVGSALSAYVRRGEIFTRPAPNTFGLIELGHESAADANDAGPPDDFGREGGKEHFAADVDDEIPF